VTWKLLLGVAMGIAPALALLAMAVWHGRRFDRIEREEREGLHTWPEAQDTLPQGDGP
jgi:hypothetical protein